MTNKLSLEQKQEIWRQHTNRSLPSYTPFVAVPVRSRPSLVGKLDARDRELVSVRSRLAQVLPEEVEPPLAAEELAKIPIYPGRKAAQRTSLKWFEDYWQPFVEAKRVGQKELRETDPGLFSALRRWLERRDRRIWELVPPLPGNSSRKSKA